MLLNAKSSNGGGVRVAISVVDSGAQDFNRTLDECLKVGSDVLSAPVTWGGGSGSDLSHLMGASVRLKFELTAAQLFSFRFE